MDNRDHIPIEFMRRASTAVPPSVLEEYANHRLHFAVRRFAFQLRRIIVRLDDENGPRRGEDSRCVISVELNHGAPIVVEAATAWPTASITAAARRLNEVIRRRVDREHTLRRHSAWRRNMTTAPGQRGQAVSARAVGAYFRAHAVRAFATPPW